MLLFSVVQADIPDRTSNFILEPNCSDSNFTNTADVFMTSASPLISRCCSLWVLLKLWSLPLLLLENQSSLKVIANSEPAWERCHWNRFKNSGVLRLRGCLSGSDGLYHYSVNKVPQSKFSVRDFNS